MSLRLDQSSKLRAFDRVQACDVLIVGSGAAGLSAALSAANAAEHYDRARDDRDRSQKGRRDSARVVVVTKGRLGEGGSTPWAQGGIAAAIGNDDSPQRHARDTVTVGRGLCDEQAVQELTAGGPEAIEQLLLRGTRFDRDPTGDLHLGREGGHSRHRILHSDGDRTGAEISRALIAAVAAHPGVRVEEEFFAVDLLEWHGPLGKRVTGVAGLQGGRKVALVARAVILACGGAGQMYRYTTNPLPVTGDGIAMAARAGARLADLEFFQFHPTTLDVESAPGATHETFPTSSPLLTEALRGAGAHLVDDGGERFMVPLHELAELAPRDLVARTLWQRRERGERSYLDLRPVIAHHGPLEECFPTAAASCRAAKLDPEVDLIPVVPAAHYYMGGVWTDSEGRTSLPGLWAAGEVSSSGVHGANRLASNSLLEALVFGERVARRALLAGASETSLDRLARHSGVAGALDWSEPVGRTEDVEMRRQLADVLWQHAGLIRDRGALQQAREILRRFDDEVSSSAGEVRNLVLVGRLLVAAALRRTESRGGHYRTDYPQRDESWARRSLYVAADLLDDGQAAPVPLPFARPTRPATSQGTR